MKCVFCNEEATGTLYVLYHRATRKIVGINVLEYFLSCDNCSDTFGDSFRNTGRTSGFIRNLFAKTLDEIQNNIPKDEVTG